MCPKWGAKKFIKKNKKIIEYKFVHEAGVKKKTNKNKSTEIFKKIKMAESLFN